MIVFEPNWWLLLQFAVTALLPLVVGLVTVKATPGVTKGILLLALTVITNFGAELLAWWNAGASGPYDLFGAIFVSLTGFTLAVAAQFGIYASKSKDGTSLTDKLQAVGDPGPDHRQEA